MFWDDLLKSMTQFSKKALFRRITAWRSAARAEGRSGDSKLQRHGRSEQGSRAARPKSAAAPCYAAPASTVEVLESVKHLSHALVGVKPMALT